MIQQQQTPPPGTESEDHYARTPATVPVPSLDGTTLPGYHWAPYFSAPAPAVVLMHGRTGAYSSAARGTYDSSTLSRRHRMWGERLSRWG
ncbi:MAG: hypothetical protein ICV73_15500, partial [Acetobacteraceae bacterium]|nr:hypothetical protein [Acetobacteraceae bacterium]